MTVDALRHFEGHSRWEVGLDGSRDNIGGWALCCDDHVHADGSSELCDTRNGEFHFLSRGHNKVAKLVDDDNNIGHIFMTIFRVELTGREFGIIFLDVSRLGTLEQVVSVIHQLAEALERLDHLSDVGDDGIVAIRDSCKEMVFYGRIDTELHLLGVDHDEFQLRRVFLIEQ